MNQKRSCYIDKKAKVLSCLIEDMPDNARKKILSQLTRVTDL